MPREMSNKDIADAQISLIRSIAKEPEFQRRAQELQDQYPKLSDWPGYPGHTQIRSKENPEESGENVADYCNSIRDLAIQFNVTTKSDIPCDWAPELFHDFIRAFNRDRLLGATWSESLRVSVSKPVSRDNCIVVTLGIYPNASKADAQKELTRNWKEIDQALRSLPGQQDRPRRPHARPSIELERHIGWLFQHIVLGKTYVEISADWEEELDWRSYETITKAVKHLASQLGIRLRRGRPRKRHYKQRF